MSEYFEIAYAAASNRLCLFTGTGFSKAVSGNTAPSWQGLLETICDDCIETKNFKETLFSEENPTGLRLEEAAQVIALELTRNGINLHEEVAKQIDKLKLGGNYKETKKFLSERALRIVTTNYDKLLEELVGDDCVSLCPGRPIPRSEARTKVYHVHGSIDVANKMVITADDYFNFMHSESYFSRKLSTLLHENTVVILGYSLGDTNLKAILNEYRGFVRSHAVSNSVFLVSRSSVDQKVADYYSSTYGIRVISNTEIEEFFEKVGDQKSDVNSVKTASKNIKKVLNEGREFKKEYIEIENSFYEILSSIFGSGHNLKEDRVEKLIAKVIATKTELLGKSGAWEQYVHLASWLTYLGSLIDVRDTAIEAGYLTSVKFSMEHMTSTRALGYSWHAYGVWNSRWSALTADNRALVSAYIKQKSTDKDALNVTSRG